jgi:hypothetical protein
VVTGEATQLALELAHLLLDRAEHRRVRVDERAHVHVEVKPAQPAASLR